MGIDELETWPWDFPTCAEGFEGVDENDCMSTIMHEADKVPLFQDSTLSILGLTLVLLTCLKGHGVANTLVDDLLGLLSKIILPQPNNCPKTEREATSILKSLGLSYNIIHACPNKCALFKGPLEKELSCPMCGVHRYYKRGRSIEPRRVLHHFPLIPRLRRMFDSPSLAKMLTWHEDGRMKDSLIRCALDSPMWAHVNNTWPDFAPDSRNLRLMLATDGINPFAQRSCTWSTWPVMVMILNLPLRLATKKFFILLTLIISGPTAPRSKSFDIYLALILDELFELWRIGVWTRDCLKRLSQEWFMMRALLMCTITDFLGLGLIYGAVTKGYPACTHCKPHTTARQSAELRKIVYNAQHR